MDVSETNTLQQAPPITCSTDHAIPERKEKKTKIRPPLHVAKWTTPHHAAHDQNDGHHVMNPLELKIVQGTISMKLNALEKVWCF
jgi:hypothetical protein